MYTGRARALTTDGFVPGHRQRARAKEGAVLFTEGDVVNVRLGVPLLAESGVIYNKSFLKGTAVLHKVCMYVCMYDIIARSLY